MVPFLHSIKALLHEGQQWSAANVSALDWQSPHLDTYGVSACLLPFTPHTDIMLHQILLREQQKHRPESK